MSDVVSEKSSIRLLDQEMWFWGKFAQKFIKCGESCLAS